MQVIGIAAFALLAFSGHDPVDFRRRSWRSTISPSLRRRHLVAYMSSLTSLGYTATQYALLSSTYAWAGKILKGFSGTLVEAWRLISD